MAALLNEINQACEQARLRGLNQLAPRSPNAGRGPLRGDGEEHHGRPPGATVEQVAEHSGRGPITESHRLVRMESTGDDNSIGSIRSARSTRILLLS